MPDHWDWAAQHVVGDYVMVLPDRRMLKQGALTVLSEFIESTNGAAKVMTWHEAHLSTSHILSMDAVGTGRFVPFSSSDVLARAMRKYVGIANYLPLGLNSCTRRDVLEAVRATTGRVFAPLSPDVSFAFSVLCVAETVYCYDSYLVVSQGFGLSNAGRVLRGDSSYRGSLGHEAEFVHVPIKSPLIVASFYEDLLRAVRRFGGALSWANVDAANFYECCWREIAAKRGNSPFSAEVRRIVRQYRAALASETPSRRREVALAMRNSCTWKTYARHLVVRAIGQPMASSIKATIERARGKQVHESSLAACGFRHLGLP